MSDRIKGFIESIQKQFLQMNDSPHNIALAFSLGVFLGILPFTGVVAAITVAWYLRLNKAAAILGSVLTNTWMSIIILAVSVKMSSKILNISGEHIGLKFQDFFQNFNWNKLTDLYILKILTVVAGGFLFLSIIIGFFSYLMCLLLVLWQRSYR